MTTESKLLDDILKYLKELGRQGVPIWWTKLRGLPGRQVAGLPDLWIVCCGKTIVVEAKAPGGKATRLQMHRLLQIGQAGGVAVVARSVDDVRNALDLVLT